MRFRPTPEDQLRSTESQIGKHMLLHVALRSRSLVCPLFYGSSCVHMVFSRVPWALHEDIMGGSVHKCLLLALGNRGMSHMCDIDVDGEHSLAMEY